MLSLAAPAAAQDLRPFCAERPGKATPPCIVDADHLQLETGVADALLQPGDDVVTLGATELRFGITRRLEAQVGWAPLLIGRQTGVGDATLSLKLGLSDPDKDGPAVAAQLLATAPTATHGFGAGGWTGGLRLPMQVTRGDLSFAATPEVDVARNVSGHGDHAAGSVTLALGRAFGATSLGAELWGFVDDDPAGRTHQASFDLTAARGLGQNAQLDAGLNLGLTRATPDVELYVGVARRF
jgi:hypothetical protein